MYAIPRRIYNGYVNNTIHTFHGEITEYALRRKLELAKNYGWPAAHELVPNVGPIATFVTPENFTPGLLGRVTGVFPEMGRWREMGNLVFLDSGVSFGDVPFCNSIGPEQDRYVLTDQQFLELFGFERPWNAVSPPRLQIAAEVAAGLPAFWRWSEMGLFPPRHVAELYSPTAHLAKPELVGPEI